MDEQKDDLLVAEEEASAEKGADAQKAEKDGAKKFPWFHPDDWTRAEIDCTVYGFGTFEIHVPPMDLLRKGDNDAGGETDQKGDDLARRRAADFRSYIKSHRFEPEHPSGCNVAKFGCDQLPKPNATFEAWRKWYAKLPEKVAARITTGIILFNRDYGVDLAGN